VGVCVFFVDGVCCDSVDMIFQQYLLFFTYTELSIPRHTWYCAHRQINAENVQRNFK